MPSSPLRSVVARFLPPAVWAVLAGLVGLLVGDHGMLTVLLLAAVGLGLGVAFYFTYQRPLEEERRYREQLAESYGKERAAHEALRRDHEVLAGRYNELLDSTPRIDQVEIEYAPDEAGVRHGLVRIHNAGEFGIFDGKYRISGPSAAGQPMANQDLQVAWKYDPRTNTDEGRSRLARGDSAAIRLAKFEETETGWSVRLIAAYPEDVISPGGFFEARDGKGKAGLFEVDLWLFSEPSMLAPKRVRLRVTKDSIVPIA